MKNIKSILFALLVIVSFSACSDKDYDPSSGPGSETGPDYLVMLYSVGGGSLDQCLLSNIYQALDAGSNDKVKMTVQYKLSAAEQEQFPEFDGVRRFDLDENRHLAGTMEDALEWAPIITKPEVEYRNLFAQLKNECVGNALSVMSESDSLASFITWSMKKHPNAKRTILILSGHGSGWQIYDDGIRDTRSILFDDNVGRKPSTLNQIVAGIKKSAVKIDLLYTDACLMGMYENLYGYAECTKYLIAASGSTPDAGGEYSKFLTLLKNAGTSDSGFETSMCKYTDYLVSEEWWRHPDILSMELGGLYQDIAFYDLSKLNKLTVVLKKVVDTMVEKYTSDESVEPTAEEVIYGEHFSGYFNKAFGSCQIAYYDEYFPLSSVPSSIVPYLIADSVKLVPDPDNVQGTEYVSFKQLLKWLRYAPTENAKVAYQTYPEDWKMLKKRLFVNPSYPLTDVLRIIDKELTSVGAKNNPFGQLKAELIASIKELVHVSCTPGDFKPGIDQAYELCSPGINIIPFNDAYYDDANAFIFLLPTPEEALAIYRQTTFDKLVGWSRMLQLIKVFPNQFLNPLREDVGIDLEEVDGE